MQVEGRQGQVTATADQILGEIREFCRATHTAESTFGRLVVNDGKLVSRLRDGARITTGTLDKVRAYLEHRPAALPGAKRPFAAVNRQRRRRHVPTSPGGLSLSTTAKYLLFVSTCSERPRSATAFRWSSAIWRHRRRRAPMPASATAPCCRG